MRVAHNGHVTVRTARIEGYRPERPGPHADSVIEFHPDVPHDGSLAPDDIEASPFPDGRLIAGRQARRFDPWHNHFDRPSPSLDMEGLDDLEVRRLPTRAWGGAKNMALDAVAAETVAGGGPGSVRVYHWEPSTLSLGYAQDPDTIDWEYCTRNGITVTRRPTGGGAIYHDARGDISYSIVLPRDPLPNELTAAYQRLCQPILDAFETLGIPVRFAESGRPAAYEPACYLRGLHPAHDLVVGTPDGERKISGNAQHRQRDAVVQHGSILYEIPVERHVACFADPDAGTDAFERRTTAVTDHADIGRGELRQALERSLAAAFGTADGEWTDEELTRADEIVDQRFGADQWVTQGPAREA